MNVCLRLCLMMCLCLSIQVPALALTPVDCGHAAPSVMAADAGCCDGQTPATPHAACDAAACAVHCAAAAGISAALGLESGHRIAEQIPAPGFRARIAPVYRHERPPRAAVSIV
jgi:hypothetical protein